MENFLLFMLVALLYGAAMFIVGRYSRRKKIIELEKTVEVMTPAVLHWVDVPPEKRFQMGAVVEDERHAWSNFCGVDHAFTDKELESPKARAVRLKARGIHP